MFSKRSRYRKLPDEVILDAKGRMLLSKSIRLSPEVDGFMFHTVEEVDRLDHIAQKYYKQSLKWWRICDANQEFLSPLGLLGKDPNQTCRCIFDPDEFHATLPWSIPLRAVRNVPGIKRVIPEMTSEYIPVPQAESVEVTHVQERIQHSFLIVYNTTMVTTATISHVISGTGFCNDIDISFEEISRTGKKIVIPRDTTT